MFGIAIDVAFQVAVAAMQVAGVPERGDVPEHGRVSTFGNSAQFEAALARLASGDLAVVWTSRRQQEGSAGIYLERLDRDGAALGGEQAVNLWTPGAQTSPAIASLADGGFLIVWQSHGQDGDRGSIVARRFDRHGVGGDERLVNATADGDQAAPVVASAADGSACVAWASDEDAIVLRPVLADGAWGEELRVSRGTAVRTPSIAMSSPDRAMVAWTEDDRRGDPCVRLALVDLVAERVLDVETVAYDAYEPTLAAGGDGGAILTYEAAIRDGAQAACAHEAWAALVDARGCVVSTPVCLGPAVAASPTLLDGPDPSRRYAVALGAPTLPPSGSDQPIRSRVSIAFLDEAGRACGPVERLTDALPGGQSLRQAAGTSRLVALAGGGYAIAWDGDAGLGDASAAHVTIAGGQPLARATGTPLGIDPATARAASGADGTASPHVPPTFDPRDVERGPRTIAWSDLGVGFDAVVDTGWTPPDCSMAVGPNHVLAMTNGRISIFTKAGAILFTDEIEGAGGFWGSVGATSFVFDPECVYDPIHDRYWAMASEAASAAGKSYALIAVSDDGDPIGTWYRYRLETTALAGTVFDSPNISIGDQAVYVTGDGNAGNYQVFIWDVASFLAGQAPAIAKSLNISTAVQSAGMPPIADPTAPGLYLLEHKEAGSNTKVKIYCLRQALTTPIVSSVEVTVPTYGPPEDPPQKGTTVRPDTFDARFWSVDYRNGSLWGTHHVNASRVVARWYEFQMNGWPTSGSLPTLRQSGSIDLGATVRTFFSAIGVDDQGNAALTCARSSPDEYISMLTTFRTPSDPLGTMRLPIIAKTNTGAYTEASRWGDYAAVRRDPAAPLTAPVFWANHEYAVSASSWRSWVQSFTVPGPSPDLNGDGSVNATDLAVLLGGWGGAGLGDLDLDGTIGPADLALLLGAWS